MLTTRPAFRATRGELGQVHSRLSRYREPSWKASSARQVGDRTALWSGTRGSPWPTGFPFHAFECKLCSHHDKGHVCWSQKPHHQQTCPAAAVTVTDRTMQERRQRLHQEAHFSKLGNGNPVPQIRSLALWLISCMSLCLRTQDGSYRRFCVSLEERGGVGAQ